MLFARCRLRWLQLRCVSWQKLSQQQYLGQDPAMRQPCCSRSRYLQTPHIRKAVSRHESLKGAYRDEASLSSQGIHASH